MKTFWRKCGPMAALRRLAWFWFYNEWLPMPGAWAPHVLAFALGCGNYGRVQPPKKEGT